MNKSESCYGATVFRTVVALRMAVWSRGLTRPRSLVVKVVSSDHLDYPSS